MTRLTMAIFLAYAVIGGYLAAIAARAWWGPTEQVLSGIVVLLLAVLVAQWRADTDPL